MTIIEKILMQTDLSIGEALRDTADLEARKNSFQTNCKYENKCPDIARLREGEHNEELFEQYIELCSTCGHKQCLTYKKFKK